MNDNTASKVMVERKDSPELRLRMPECISEPEETMFSTPPPMHHGESGPRRSSWSLLPPLENSFTVRENASPGIRRGRSLGNRFSKQVSQMLDRRSDHDWYVGQIL